MEFTTYINIAYLVAAICFIYGLKMLSHPRTARNGNIISSIGMLIAILSTLSFGFDPNYNIDWKLIFIALGLGTIIGAIFAIRVQMTQMPQLVAIFNGFGGGASALVAYSEYLSSSPTDTFPIITIALSILIGTLTLTGSFIAFGKLQGFISGQPITFPGQQLFNGILALLLIFGVICGIDSLSPMTQYIDPSQAFYLIIGLSALLGILLVIPIGGADMPVVISLLNSYSGIAAAMTGFVLVASGNNAAGNALIICGSLVGASGIILTKIMCKGMNRSLTNVIFGAVGGEVESSGGNNGKEINIKSYSTEEAAMIFDAAEKIIIVPGYGLAVAQAQHAARELADHLESKGKKVLYLKMN